MFDRFLQLVKHPAFAGDSQSVTYFFVHEATQIISINTKARSSFSKERLLAFIGFLVLAGKEFFLILSTVGSCPAEDYHNRMMSEVRYLVRKTSKTTPLPEFPKVAPEETVVQEKVNNPAES